jgi:hypothetical protein
MRRPINVGNVLGCLLNQSGATAERIDVGPIRASARGLAARAWHSDWAAQIIAHLSYLPELGDKVVQARGHSGLHRPSLVVACTAPASSDACRVPRATFDRCTSAGGLVRCMSDGMPGGMGFSQQDACNRMRATCNERSRCGAGEGVRHRHYRRIFGAARTGALTHGRERAFARTRTVRRLSQAIIVAVIGTVFKFEDVATATLSSCIAGAAMRPVGAVRARTCAQHAHT